MSKNKPAEITQQPNNANDTQKRISNLRSSRNTMSALGALVIAAQFVFPAIMLHDEETLLDKAAVEEREKIVLDAINPQITSGYNQLAQGEANLTIEPVVIPIDYDQLESNIEENVEQAKAAQNQNLLTMRLLYTGLGIFALSAAGFRHREMKKLEQNNPAPKPL